MSPTLVPDVVTSLIGIADLDKVLLIILVIASLVYGIFRMKRWSTCEESRSWEADGRLLAGSWFTL